MFLSQQMPALARSPLRWLRSIRWHRYQARLLRSGWYDPAARSDSDAVFIGGCPRSGTTLLREMLDRHSRLVCGIETALLVPGFETRRIAERWEIDRAEVERLASECRNLVELADRFYGELARRMGKARWVDKAPANVRVIRTLLTWFPNARFLHLVRDGRDVVCSLRTHPRQVLRRGKIQPARVRNPISRCAETWFAEVTNGIAFRGHPRYLEVPYEQLVTSPEEMLRSVCTFLGEPYEPEMLQPNPSVAGNDPPARLINNDNAAGSVSTASIGRWRQELAPAEREEFANIAGELLLALGYVTDHRWLHE